MTHPLSKAMQTNHQRDWKEVVEWARGVPVDVRVSMIIALHGSLPVVDACETLRFLAMGAGDPVPPFAALMEEADEWASLASEDEMKSYAAACWLNMSEHSRKRFVHWMTEDAHPKIEEAA